MRGRNQKQQQLEVTVPHQLRCPISLEMMKDPVILCTGITYDRHSIETWLDAGNDVCPVTKQRLHSRDLIPNHTLRRLIQHWCVLNSSNGVERIPTPTTPLSSAEVARILNDISRGQSEATEKLRSLAERTDRNRKCIASAPNAPLVLARALTANHLNSPRSCENALAVLATILPIGDDSARAVLASADSLRCVVGILRHGNPEGRRDAVSILQEVAGDEEFRGRLAAADGLAEGLVQLTRESQCPAAVKACIACIYHIACDEKAREKLVQAGAVAALLEILPEADGGACERALAALDALCNSTLGQSAACEHALTVPVVVKKMLRVSDLATELAVSILWTICHNSSSNNSLVLEALQVGAFVKLLVLVQIGCAGKTRERATGLLKLFNKCTSGEWDRCTNTLDLKQVRRSF